MENYQHVLPVKRPVVKMSARPLMTSSRVAKREGMSALVTHQPGIQLGEPACSPLIKAQLCCRTGVTHRETRAEAGFCPFQESLSCQPRA